MPGAVGQDGVDRADVISHQTVADGFGTAGVVPGHAADGAARMGRWIDREEHAMRTQCGVERTQGDPGLDEDRAGGGVHVENFAQMFRTIDDQRAVDGLAALAGAAAAGKDRNARLLGYGHGDRHVLDGFGDDDTQGLDLVDGGVGGIAAAVGAPEQHFAADFAGQFSRQAGIARLDFATGCRSGLWQRRGRAHDSGTGSDVSPRTQCAAFWRSAPAAGTRRSGQSPWRRVSDPHAITRIGRRRRPLPFSPPPGFPAGQTGDCPISSTMPS